MSPLEQIEDAVTALNKSLADDLIGKVIKLPLRQFEKFVIKLLAAMGYDSMPGSRASVTKKVGDGGIDGVLRADKFGFDSIYIQAKQWKKDSAVGSPEIQKFAGSMSLNGAQKGLFITTAHFTADAVKTSKANPACKMVLIDGDALAKLMIEYDIGVSTTEIFKVKSIDSDFFNDFD
ncbi:MAG: restriction endonuclease [Oscillospiraceae bacterium]|nr:restriction endonuclease [Oscillospiraceae bacterium]